MQSNALNIGNWFPRTGRSKLLKIDNTRISYFYLIFKLCSLFNFGQISFQGPAEVENPNKISGPVCRHDYRLNEEIGIVCLICGFVCTEIKDVMPSFVSKFAIQENPSVSYALHEHRFVCLLFHPAQIKEKIYYAPGVTPWGYSGQW